jgi:hypothetical protein
VAQGSRGGAAWIGGHEDESLVGVGDRDHVAVDSPLPGPGWGHGLGAEGGTAEAALAAPRPDGLLANKARVQL